MAHGGIHYDWEQNLGNLHGEVDTTSTDFKSATWSPSDATILSMEGNQLAEGFGLGAEDYGMYFQPFDPWKKDFAGAEKDIGDRKLESDYTRTTTRITDMYESQMAGFDRGRTSAGKELAASVGQGAKSMQTSWLDTSSAMSARGAQAGFTGSGRGRSKGRYMQQETQSGFKDVAAASTRAFDTMIEDIDQSAYETGVQKDYDMATAIEDRDFGKEENALDFTKAVVAEEKEYVDDVWDTLAQLAADDAWEE